MSLQSWRLATIIIFVVFVFIILLLSLAKPLKNKYFYACREDKLEKTEKRKGARYNVYSVLGRSASFIDKYVIKTIGKKKTLICDYVNKYDFISYYILLFNKNNDLMKIMEVKEYNVSLCSKSIKLPKKCVNINVVVNKYNDVDMNINLKGEVSKAAVMTFSIFESLALLCFLFILRQILVEVICFNTKTIYIRSEYDIYTIVLISVLSIINLLVISNSLQKAYHLKPTKVKKGRKAKAV